MLSQALPLLDCWLEKGTHFCCEDTSVGTLGQALSIFTEAGEATQLPSDSRWRGHRWCHSPESSDA